MHTLLVDQDRDVSFYSSDFPQSDEERESKCELRKARANVTLYSVMCLYFYFQTTTLRVVSKMLINLCFLRCCFPFFAIATLWSWTCRFLCDYGEIPRARLIPVSKQCMWNIFIPVSARSLCTNRTTNFKVALGLPSLSLAVLYLPTESHQVWVHTLSELWPLSVPSPSSAHQTRLLSGLLSLHDGFSSTQHNVNIWRLNIPFKPLRLVLLVEKNRSKRRIFCECLLVFFEVSASFCTASRWTLQIPGSSQSICCTI